MSIRQKQKFGLDLLPGNLPLDIIKDGRVRGTDASAAVSLVGGVLTRITIPPAGSNDEGEGDGEAGRSLAGVPAIDSPKVPSNVPPRTRVEILARWTDQVFTAPLPTIPEPIVASATSSSERSADIQTSETSLDAQLLSLDGYFERLGKKRAGAH